MSRRILIVGGSTRAAADSVRRAGWEPICADLFADDDLRQTADVVSVRDYPESLPDDIKHVRADGWFYCGALENHPEILEKILERDAQLGPLLGADPSAVRVVRDPRWLAQVLKLANVPTLEIKDERAPPAPDGSWMQKPLASAGGRRVRVWDAVAAAAPYEEPHYFQRRVSGVGLSALFHLDSVDVECLGFCQELEDRTGSRAPSQFAYCGSFGPVGPMCLSGPNTIPASVAGSAFTSGIPRSASEPSASSLRGSSDVLAQVTTIARTIAERTPGLRGLIGFDLQLRDGIVWLVEVNPRYTASVEVLELAQGRSFLNSERSRTPRSVGTACPNVGIVMKQILYANRTLTAPDLREHLPASNPWIVPMMADIPIQGTTIEPGWPICTVLAEGQTKESVAYCLAQRVADVRAVLDRVE